MRASTLLSTGVGSWTGCNLRDDLVLIAEELQVEEREIT